MILKIKRYAKGQEWWILDDLRKISYGQRMDDRNTVTSNEFLPDIHIQDFNIGLTTEVAVIFATCRLSNGSEFTVQFDTLAYLCNDDGKTVEKLVANYFTPASTFGEPTA